MSKKINTKHNRFLALLRRRYGYDNEKAVDELERLLKQFYRTNRSLGIHGTRPNFKVPPIELSIKVAKKEDTDLPARKGEINENRSGIMD